MGVVVMRLIIRRKWVVCSVDWLLTELCRKIQAQWLSMLIVAENITLFKAQYYYLLAL